MTPTDLRQQLRQAGFNPLPLTGKRPVLEAWQKRTQTSAGDVDLWAKVFPNATNTGVLTALTPSFDIDIRNPEAAQAVEDLVRARFDEHGCILVRFGNAPKRAIPFRTDTPFDKIIGQVVAPDGDTKQKIEFLGNGQQIVVAGIHPDTHKPYSWHGGMPGQIKYEDLPYLSHDDAQALVIDAVELLVAEHGYSRPVSKSKANGGQATSGTATGTADWTELLANIQAGHELHDNVRDLAAKLVTAGTHDGAAVNLIRGALDTSTAPRDDRFAERYDDVPRAVDGAREKFGQAKPAAPLTFVNMSDWDTTPTPERQWAVFNRVPLRQPTLLTGEGAVGKSIVELHLCVAHVLGRDWLGAKPEPGGAIYAGAEDDTDELRRRLTDIATHYDATFGDLIAGGLHLVCLTGEDALLGVPDRHGKIVPTPLYSQLLEAAHDLQPKHIGLDTSADMFGGNEIDRTHVRQFVGLLRKLAIAGNSGVVLLAHPSLTGIATGTGLSGSTGWHNSVRARMYLKSPKPVEGEQPDSDLRELEFKKNQYGRVAESIVLRWRNGLFLPETQGRAAWETAAREQRVDDTFMAVLRKLIDQGQTVSPNKGPTYAPAIIAQQPGVKAYRSSDFAAAMQRLLDAKKIHIVTTGAPTRQRSRLALGEADIGG